MLAANGLVLHKILGPRGCAKYRFSCVRFCGLMKIYSRSKTENPMAKSTMCESTRVGLESALRPDMRHRVTKFPGSLELPRRFRTAPCAEDQRAPGAFEFGRSFLGCSRLKIRLRATSDQKLHRTSDRNYFRTFLFLRGELAKTELKDIDEKHVHHFILDFPI